MNIRQLITYALKHRASCEKNYRMLERIDTKDKLIDFQVERLEQLAVHAYKHVPYYKSLFAQTGFVSNGEVDLSHFSELPLLRRETLRQSHDALTSDDYEARNWRYNSTGGSTGEPVTFIQDEKYRKWMEAVDHYYHKDILGVDARRVKIIVLWGAIRDLPTGAAGSEPIIHKGMPNFVFLNGFRMTETDMDRYIQVINEWKPDVIRAYAGCLYDLCRYAEKRNKRLWTPTVLVTSTETLRDEMRGQIEGVFGTKVYDLYAAREVDHIAVECRKGLMHAFTFWNYVEVLDSENQPTKQGDEGKVVITNLFNYSMPLIRYEIGDFAVLGPENCTCGNILPTLQGVTGRISDRFLLADGTIIPGYFFIHLLGVEMNQGHIKKFQVIQEEYDKIRIKVVPSGDLNSIERKKIETGIGSFIHDCKIVWDIVDDIPKTATGKYIYARSLVWNT